ncbi:MAG: hypothetical protein JO053_12555 [Acidobacteria bacterium]|nr:hypothetical protein [Acidobacteriota bacterium]
MNHKFALAICFFFVSVAGLAAQTVTSPPATKLETKNVVFGATKRFDHTRFSIDLPSTWKVMDKSNADETIFTIMDETENAVLVLHVWQPERILGSEDETVLLKNFLSGTMNTFKNTKIGGPRTDKDGRIAIDFTWDQEQDGKLYPMVGDSFVTQRGDVAALLFFAIPKEQFESHKDEASKMISSFSLK